MLDSKKSESLPVKSFAPLYLIILVAMLPLRSAGATPLFEDDSVLAVTLEGPVREVAFDLERDIVIDNSKKVRVRKGVNVKTVDLENMGDPEKDHDLYYERSPFFFLDRVRAPVQLICGANDPRCPAS